MKLSNSLSDHVRKPHLLPGTHEHFRTTPGKTFWNLMPYFRNQKNDSFCSVAATQMVVNAIKGAWGPSSIVSPLSQDEILALAQDEEWSRAVAPEGKGIPLAKLEEGILTVLRKLGLGEIKIKTVIVEDTDYDRDVLTSLLEELDSRSDRFIIANYALKRVVGDEEVGHFAPLASYSKKTDEVLIFDPDTEFHQPYWAPRSHLWKAMLDKDENSGDRRGYIVIEKAKH